MTTSSGTSSRARASIRSAPPGTERQQRRAARLSTDIVSVVPDQLPCRMAQATDRIVCGGPFFEDFEVGQLFDEAPGLTLDLRPRGPAPGAGRRPAATRARRPAQPCGHGATTRCSRTRTSVRCRDRAVDRTHPAGARQPLLPRARPAAAGVRRRHAPLEHRGRRTAPEPPARGRRRDRPRRAADPHHRPARRAGARFLAVPHDSAARRERADGLQDRFEDVPKALDLDHVQAAVPADWNLEAFRDRVPGAHFADLTAGTVWSSRGATPSPPLPSWSG